MDRPNSPFRAFQVSRSCKAHTHRAANSGGTWVSGTPRRGAFCGKMAKRHQAIAVTGRRARLGVVPQRSSSAVPLPLRLQRQLLQLATSLSQAPVWQGHPLQIEPILPSSSTGLGSRPGSHKSHAGSLGQGKGQETRHPARRTHKVRPRADLQHSACRVDKFLAQSGECFWVVGGIPLLPGQVVCWHCAARYPTSAT